MLQSNTSTGEKQVQPYRLSGAPGLFVLISLLFSLLCLGWCAYLHNRTPKVAFVRSGVIVEKYLGMQEARTLYQRKLQGWQAETDTLQTQFKVALARYDQEASRLSDAELKNRQVQLESQRQTLLQHQAAVSEKAQSEESKLTEGALNQINRFVEDYARSQGYTLVLGTTQTGSLLYASDAVDITDQVLLGLNQSYK